MRRHSNRYLPQPSPCDHPSFVSDHRPAMKEIARGQSLVTQLRAIVLPALQADERCEIVAQMFQNILDCSGKAITELQLHHQPDVRADDALVDVKKRVRRIFSVDCIKVEGATANPHHEHKRRSYYRCTYRQEQDCKATKTVQQQDDSTVTDHPVMYTVVCNGHHTCKDNNGVDSGTDDSETNTQSSSDSPSSLSTTCTDPYGNQTSLYDNKLQT